MSAQLRGRIGADFHETEQAIGRAWITLLVVCLSVVLLSAANDEVILGNQAVQTPFIGQTQYKLFSILAPALIVVLRLYLDIQIAYRARLALLAEQFKINQSRKLSPMNSWAMFAAESGAVHLAPPIAIIAIGHHASALHPEPALILYGVAAALLLWSVLQFTVLRAGLFRKLLALPAAIVVFGLAGFAVFNGEEAQYCKERYRGYGQSLVTPFLSSAHLSRVDLSNGVYSGANFSCGLMEYVNLEASDLSYADFVSTLLHRSQFKGSHLYKARFDAAEVRRSDLSDTVASFSEFREANLDGADLERAQLTDAHFSQSYIKDTNFDDSTLRSASFYRGWLRDSTFLGARLYDAEFNRIDLFEIDMQDAKLQGAKFLSLALEGVNFKGADLAHAIFDEVDVGRVVLDGADLTCADFRTASFTQVVDLSGVDPGKLAGARFPENPAARQNIRWPAGYSEDAAPDCPEEEG